MSYVMTALCALAAVLQWRVLHAAHIVEPEHLCNLRRMRIVAHAIAGGYGIYLGAVGHWLQLPLALCLMLLALVDALSAAWRLRPELFHARAARRARTH